MFCEVPIWPVVLPVAGATMVLLLWRLHRRGLLTLPRAGVAALVCTYGAGIVANTVFPIYLDSVARTSHWSVALVPFADYEWADAVTNVVIFVPVGILVSLVTGRAPWWQCLAVATAVSLGIELLQLLASGLLGGGHVADVDDLLSNIVGAALGLGLLAAVERVPRARSVVDRFRWR